MWVRKGLLHPLSVKLGCRSLAGPPDLHCQIPTLGLHKNVNDLQSILVLFLSAQNPLS